VSEFRCVLTQTNTEKAYLIRVVDREIWLPRSVIQSMTKFAPDPKGERECIVNADDWWCDKNEL
jgi:hypothetical protein